ncbi:MAG: hypothetical protein ACUZ8H_14020 [Candidatus Anammoxibacter sp.]
MSKLKWEVTENGGGGLSLWIWDEEILIYAHSGYEYDPGQLSKDIQDLKVDDCIDNWEGNEIIDEEIVRSVRSQNYEPNDIAEKGYVSYPITAPDNLIFNAKGIIPLTASEYYDDQPETKTINSSYAGLEDRQTMGEAGNSEFYN